MNRDHVAFEKNEYYDVGIIGAGYVSSAYHCPAIESLPATRIKWIADINVDQAKRVASLYSGKPIMIDSPSKLPSCDIVVLATPVIHREKYINVFGKREIPILTEKPFAVTQKEHEKYVQDSQLIATNYLRTYFGHIQQLRSLFRSGIINTPESIEIQRGWIGGSTGGNSGMYRTHPEAGGVLMERGCHTLSQIVHLFENQKISVDRSSMVTLNSMDVEFDVDLIVEFDQASLDISYKFSTLQNLQTKTKLQYPSGHIEFDHVDSGDQLKQITNHKKAFEQIVELDMASYWATTTHQGHLFSWIHFLDYIKNDYHYLGPDPTFPKVTKLIDEIRAKASVTELKS